MFRVVNTETDGDLIAEHHYDMNDIKDIWDLVVGITNDKVEANRATVIAANMAWNDEFKSGSYKYRIKCFRE